MCTITMVKLSVLFSLLCLHGAYSRRLTDDIVQDIDNDVSALPQGNLGYDYPEYGRPMEYVRINQPPLPVVHKNVGSHVELSCEAVGSPPPTIQWYKGHMRITENESFEDNYIRIEGAPALAKVSSRLVINYVLPRHEDTYYCVAESNRNKDRKAVQLIVPNRYGKEMNLSQLIDKKIVGAHHHPRVTFWASAYMDVIGSNVILPCKSVGNPNPEIIWINTDSKQVIEDDRFQVLSDGSLSIKSIAWSDMGTYKCMVRNSVGEDEVETFLYPMQYSK
ncbi:neural/ectodermal development factor IMP-L2 isoform X2 [Anthonomus grandis grandis]|uniref:neural/ectodermal development factor IMP-L2 isoform X2 n=2 Tax=Anthonomus grandis grandis TaxID=2921223 RepID=UPI002166A126|nr:neural/ectodermal development factor IMP-L2 isoform X2 [Anthonomus grandis grandis]